MKPYFLLFFFMFSLLSVAQKKTYYNELGERARKKKATYYKELSKTEDNLWKMEQFYMSGTPKFIGYAKKKNFKGKVGTHLTYYSSGKLKIKRIYKKEKLSLKEAYYESSNVKAIEEYNALGRFRNKKTFYESGQLETDVSYKDSSDDKNTNKIIAFSYYENGQLKQKDEYIQDKKGGTRNHQLISGVLYNEEGNEIPHIPFMTVPKFIGGNKLLYMFIKANLKYPKAAKKEKIQGKVLVGFVVNKNGKVEKIKALKSEDHDLEKEALRIVNLMPDWTPGTYNGKKVSVPFTSPINFKLR